MPNAFDLTSLTIINKIDAEILYDDTPIDGVMGGSYSLDFLYIGGTRYPAHAFRLRAYGTAALRALDAERDQGIGVLASGRAPQNVVFRPSMPIPGGRWDHDGNPNTPRLMRTGTVFFDIPPPENFVDQEMPDPSGSGSGMQPEPPDEVTYYLKLSILQNDQVKIAAKSGYTSSGHQLGFGPIIIIANVLFGNPAGGMTVIFNAVEGWDGTYEGRIGIADREGAVGEWLDILAEPDPASPPERRRLFGVFDRDTLEQYYEGATKQTPGQRLQFYAEIQNRYPEDTSPPTGSRINRGRTFFVYPFDVRQPSQPAKLRTGNLATPYSPLAPMVRFLWDIPSDLGFSRVGGRGASVPIDFYEYRYKLDTEIFFNEWVNFGNKRDITLTLPRSYDGKNIVFEVRGVNSVGTRDPAKRNFADLRGYIATITAQVGPTAPPKPLPEPEPTPDPKPEPTRKKPEPPQLTDAQRLAHIKDTDNWTRIGRGGKVYTYVDGGSAVVRNVPRGTRRVTFVGVPTLQSPITKRGDTNNVQTLFESALASLTANDQD